MQLNQDHALLDRPLAVIDLRLPDRLVTRPRPDALTTQGTIQGNTTDALPPPPPPPPPENPAAARRPT